jgi:hypothetical protein
MTGRAVIIRKLVGMLPLAMLTADLLRAQTTAADPRARCKEAVLPALIKDAVCTAVVVFEKPLHPVIRGVAPGGGIGAGIEYAAPLRGPWHATGEAAVTMREYWSGEIEAGYRGTRAGVMTYARLRDMTRLSFFGTGDDSELTNRTNFRLEDRVIGALGSVRVASWITLGGRVELFFEPSAPGLTAQPRHLRYQASLDIQVPAALGEALYQGATYRIAYASFSDQELDRFSFRRLDLEAQQRFALPIPHHRLTLHGWLSLSDTDAGQEVPFYLLNSLGGRWNLRSVHDDLIGSDGTDATLRGFRTFRFRDRNLLLLQAEYRIPFWGPVDATVFVDAGKVASRRGDLDLGDLEHNLGFSLSLMRGPATAARVDVGLGGEEGFQLFITIRRGLVP